MSKEHLAPQRQPWETVQYEEDPFGLGGINEIKLKIVSKNFLPSPEQLVFKEPKPAAKEVTIELDAFISFED